MRAVSDMADDLASSLNARGWATAEFITSDAVSVVREEIANVARFYTPGEIWLGAADAGALTRLMGGGGDADEDDHDVVARAISASISMLLCVGGRSVAPDVFLLCVS